MSLVITRALKSSLGFKKGLIASLVFVSLLAVAAIAVQSSPSAHAATPPDNCFGFDAQTGTITSYFNPNNPGEIEEVPVCPETGIDIPGTIGGVAVTAIGDYAFYEARADDITIPDSVTTIGDGAFAYNFMETVDIPESVTSIGNGAFQGNWLTSVVIPDGITSISDSMFYENRLSSVTLPEGITSIGNFAFGWNKFSSFIVPDGVTSIGNYAFVSNLLTSISLPESVVGIGNSAFRDNQLSSLTIPSSVTTIGSDAFSHNSLASVVIEGSPVIGNAAFAVNGSTYSGAGFSASWPNQAQYIQDTIEITRIYMTNPVGNSDTVYTEAGIQADINQDGDINDVVGGYIINPASYTAMYLNEQDEIVTPAATRVGSTISDYTLSSNPEVNLSVYYRAGNQITITPPTIDGYTTPASSTVTLEAGTENEYTFVYAAADTTTPVDPTDPSVPSTPNPASPTDPAVPGAPNTSVAPILERAVQSIVLIIGSGIAAVAAVVLIRRHIAQRS